MTWPLAFVIVGSIAGVVMLVKVAAFLAFAARIEKMDNDDY